MHAYAEQYNYLSLSSPCEPATRRRAKAGGGAFRKWVRAAYRKWQRNMMITAFESLDEATLRDIGVHRGEIRNIVDGFDDRELTTIPVAATDDACRR